MVEGQEAEEASRIREQAQETRGKRRTFRIVRRELGINSS